MPGLLGSLDQPSYGLESKKGYAPRLVSRVEYGQS